MAEEPAAPAPPPATDHQQQQQPDAATATAAAPAAQPQPAPPPPGTAGTTAARAPSSSPAAVPPLSPSRRPSVRPPPGVGPPQASTQGAAAPEAAFLGQRVYENTYRLKPEVKFQSQRTTKIVQDILEAQLKKAQYSPEKAAELTKVVSDEILRAVKKLEFDRYKYVVEVVISENKGQGFRVASRSLWDATTDSYASFSYHNATLTCVAMVFGCYVE